MSQGQFKQQTFKSSSGNEYVFQYPGHRAAIRIQDKMMDKGGRVNGEVLADELLEHVVVSPKMKMDDYESLGELTEVCEAASTFLFSK